MDGVVVGPIAQAQEKHHGRLMRNGPAEAGPLEVELEDPEGHMHPKWLYMDFQQPAVSGS